MTQLFQKVDLGHLLKITKILYLLNIAFQSFTQIEQVNKYFFTFIDDGHHFNFENGNFKPDFAVFYTGNHQFRAVCLFNVCIAFQSGQ
jgi:hypothetical protein